MDRWTRTLAVLATAPAVVVSTVVWVMAAALLPAGAGGLLLLLAPVAVALLWLPRSGQAGRAGRLVERAGTVLAGAREPTDAELAALRPVTARLLELALLSEDREHEPMRLLVSRSARSYPPVRPFGRDQVVISPVLAEAVFRRQLGVEAAVALIVHTIGWLRAQPTRGAVALAALTLPWRAGAAVVSRISAASRWVPGVGLVGFAWRLRPVVGMVAVAQAVVEGRTVSAAVVAVFPVATCTTPAARRARDSRLQVAADRYVTARGLGPTLSRALYLVGAPSPDMERAARLRDGRPAPSPAAEGAGVRRLHLVPS